ncbi:structure-specific endonuclease subunit SLX4 isoform X1 [Loxodonta africana]|uniref:structure-specific endonuclease subunit SLX4 isoform X1 n=1 Tax=Loxodonta africana TaxID=9785 RepID=UPI0030D14D05
MMDESDDDFKELCTSFFQRVKKNGTKELSGERKKQKASDGTQIRSKLKRPKQTTTKSKTLQGPVLKKTRPGSQAARTKNQGAAKLQEWETAPAVSGKVHVLTPAPAPDLPALQDSAQSTQPEGAPSSDTQPSSSGLTVVAPSPSKLRTAELVLQRMQRFKRADPARLKHAPGACSLKAMIAENAPKDPQEEPMVGNGCEPGSPATENDGVMALALQQELGQERVPTLEESLEEEGWFFCQICQKNLSSMNVTRREQHMNRCLDEAEKSLRPSTPQIPECPICGKLFLTSKSRSSHLKQCAVKMEVCPQLLLQAVRLQTAQLDRRCSPTASGFSPQVGSLKRKGAPNKKEPQKRRKVNQPKAPSEDILVAMALSRSEVEQSKTVLALGLERAFSEWIKPGAEKKSRKKKLPASLPPLLVQDSEATWKQTEENVATLFAEAVELSSTPPLPASRILKNKSEKAGWLLQLPEGKQSFLWEGSALTRTWAPEAFYTAGLVPPIMSRRPAQGLPKLPTWSLRPPDQPKPDVQTHPTPCGPPPMGHSPREDPAEPDPKKASPFSSQREHQALQDLVDLAREGLSPSQGPSSIGLASWDGEAAIDLVPSGLPLSGFVLPSEEEHLERGGGASLSLGVLVSDFRAMVNNPHLSDVQFQVDSGEVLYAHKFVLYARCPLLIQHVNSEGFFAVEDGDLRTQRVLLSDVSTEAARVFLHYLYTADTGWPSHLAPSLSSLALRFGMSELVHLCEQAPPTVDVEGGLRKEKEDENCESRAENFQELLRLMWVGEEEEAEALSRPEDHGEDREKMDEAEMEEIYEFAATQWKLLQEERAAEREEEADQLGEDHTASGCVLASVLVQAQLEDAGQKESPKQGSDKAPTRWKTVEWSAPLASPGQRSRSEEDAETCELEASRETLHHSSTSSSPGKHRAERKEGASLPSISDYEQLFPSAQGEYAEPSQITSDPEEQKGTVVEKEAEVSCSPRHHQAQAQPARDGGPSWSHLSPHCTDGSSPLKPPLQSAVSKVISQNSWSPVLPPEQRRDSSIPALLMDPGHHEDRGGSYMSACKSKGGLITTEKSPSIDLTQSDPGHLCSRLLCSPSNMNRDVGVILLDSDEELELEQTGMKSVSNSPPEERKVLEVSPMSSELFSVINIDDTDPECSPSPVGGAAELQSGKGEQSGHGVPQGSRGWLRLFCDAESSPKDSTTDTSWLVPVTPLASRGRPCSSQTPISGLRSRTSVDVETHLRPRAVSENREVNESTFPVIVPQSPPQYLVPATPGSSESGRRAYTSPSGQRPRYHQHISPVALRPLQRHSSPKPYWLSRATVGEVVEVEDSDDEQGVASYQANRPLPHGEPSIADDDYCWSVEPHSPIPIDHLNLERTGPLSTSSPSSRAREALGSVACGSSSPLGTSPIQGSCTDQGGAHKQSPQASSPGSSRLSLLNSALWDDWDREEKSLEGPPLAWRLRPDQARKPGGPETPKGAHQKKNLPPKVPITPMPRYSVMETPVLKKELDRFGVRPLPKRQMVLKLKEIFQYTHQTLESDSEDEIPSSQVPLHVPYSLAYVTEASKTSGAGGHSPPEATASPIPKRPMGPTEIKTPRCRKKQPGESPPALHIPLAEEEPLGSDGDAQLPASQEPMATSMDSSDGSFGSQSSSSHEFGAAFESEGDDEGQEEVTASQVAVQAADIEEAVWRYIHSQPALYRKVLLYQPLELVELQAELRQNGIRMAAGKLLDFLDAQCITFTTAATRKGQLKRKRRRPVGKKKQGQD